MRLKIQETKTTTKQKVIEIEFPFFFIYYIDGNFHSDTVHCKIEQLSEIMFKLIEITEKECGWEIEVDHYITNDSIGRYYKKDKITFRDFEEAQNKAIEFISKL